MSEKSPSGITKASPVELSIVILICGAIATGASWATRISIAQEEMHKDLQKIDAKLADGTADRWTRQDMSVWVQQANREVELWSERAERGLGLDPGAWERFSFPNPVHQKRKD